MDPLTFDDSLPGEEWRPVNGAPEYAVSNRLRWRRKYAARRGWTEPRTTHSLPITTPDGDRRYREVTAAVREAFGEDVLPRKRSGGGPPKKLGPYLGRVGRQSDRSLARLANCTVISVRRYRQRNGIPTYDPKKVEG